MTTAKTRLDRQMQTFINNNIQQFAMGERQERIEELGHELSIWKCGEFERYAANLQSIADTILIQAGYPRLTGSYSSTRRWATLTNLANVDKSDLKYHRFVELIRKALVQLAETELHLLWGQCRKNTYHFLSDFAENK